MALQLMLGASLRKYLPGYNAETGHSVEIEPGSTIRDVARLFFIPEAEVKLIMLDGVSAQWDTVVSGNERLAFFPPVGGG